MSELVGPAYEPSEASSPEAILQFLSEHREGLDGDGKPRPRPRPTRRRTPALPGLVVALVLAGAGVLVWTHFAHTQSASPRRTHPTAPGTGAGTSKNHAASTSKGRARETAAAKTKTKTKTQESTATPVARAGAASWNRGLQPWGNSKGRHLPGFYYAWATSRVSCAEYATYGCWKLDAVSRRGCPGGLTAVAQEMQGDTVVGTTWGIGPRANARARVPIELDADRKNVTVRLNSLFCRPRS